MLSDIFPIPNSSEDLERDATVEYRTGHLKQMDAASGWWQSDLLHWHY